MISWEELFNRAQAIFLLMRVGAITEEERKELVRQLRDDWGLEPLPEGELEEEEIKPQPAGTESGTEYAEKSHPLPEPDTDTISKNFFDQVI